jgi:PKD repeat protein
LNSSVFINTFTIQTKNQRFMKRISLLFIFFFFCGFVQYGQTITLTFLGQDATTHNYLPLESVYIQNTTLGCDTVIYGDAPSINLTSTLGIDDPQYLGSESFSVLSPVPNPFNGSTSVRIFMNQTGKLKLTVLDLKGVVISEYENKFSSGLHRFEIRSSKSGLLLLRVSDGSEMKSVKLLCRSEEIGDSKISYMGISDKVLKNTEAVEGFKFQFGNQLLFKSVKAGYYDVILTDSPVQNSTYTFLLTSIVLIPTVTTDSITGIGPHSATGGGEVSSDGGAFIDARGVCWSIYPDPTTSDFYTVNGNGAGVFISYLTGLAPNTLYYVRAYASNVAGTGYGDETTFTTSDQDSMLAILAGSGSKTWKLLRDVSTGRYPLEVGPYDHSTIWWAMGLNNDELANRHCMLNDEWTFSTDGTLEFDAKGDYWADGGIFDPANICQSTDNMVGVNGEDLSAWGNGTHAFELVAGDNAKISAIGYGAYIAFYRSATDYEVTILNPKIQDEVTYSLLKLTDGNTDTLIVEASYYFQQGDPSYGGYWRYVLVHYDDPNDEPPMPSPLPTAGFTYMLDGLTVSFDNTSLYADSYVWDFGDGATSTEISPAHTYAADGTYTVTLTAYNANGENSFSQNIIVGTSAGVLTEGILTAGPWKIQVSNHSIYVGPGMGSDAWWICPLANLDGTYIGTTDDWSCMADDEFVFSAGGGYEYKTNGGSRNDGYMGTPNGCWSDAEIAASPGAPFGSCASHTFAFIPATQTTRAIITLTNGPGFAAFIGFMKGYYGGENVNGADPPNDGNPTNRYEVMNYYEMGDKEILIVTVDITSDHSGTAAWTMTLER